MPLCSDRPRHSGRHLPRTATIIGCGVLLLGATSCSKPKEIEIIANSMAGQPATIQEMDSTPTVWLTSADNSDPRPGGSPDPAMCRISGGGSARLVEPDGESATLDETTLYPVAEIEDLTPPASVTCAGPGVENFYIGTN